MKKEIAIKTELVKLEEDFEILNNTNFNFDYGICYAPIPRIKIENLKKLELLVEFKRANGIFKISTYFY